MRHEMQRSLAVCVDCRQLKIWHMFNEQDALICLRGCGRGFDCGRERARLRRFDAGDFTSHVELDFMTQRFEDFRIPDGCPAVRRRRHVALLRAVDRLGRL